MVGPVSADPKSLLERVRATRARCEALDDCDDDDPEAEAVSREVIEKARNSTTFARLRAHKSTPTPPRGR